MSTDLTKDLLEALKGLMALSDHRVDLRDAAKVARAAIARAEAALAVPQPYDNGWIPWAGGKCPLGWGVLHQVRFRNGDESDWNEYPYRRHWEHNGSATDLIAYRVVKS